MVVSVNGVEVFYTTRGRGVPCIVPCILGTSVYERLTPPPLTDHFQFIYVDVRGSGRSTGDPADLTFDVLSSDLEAVRADLGLPRVAVLGYSIMGAAALEYGRRYPQTVSHVIMAGTPPTGDLQAMASASAAFFDADGSDERKAILRESMARLPPDTPPSQAVFAQTPMRFFDPRFDAAALFAGSMFNPRLFAHLFGTLTARWTILDGLESLHVPILLAHGRFDYVVPFTMWNDIVGKVPRLRLHLFERSGHQTFFEEPGRFADVVLAWMAECNVTHRGTV
jgi:proline iminopeptidase